MNLYQSYYIIEESIYHQDENSILCVNSEDSLFFNTAQRTDKDLIKKDSWLEQAKLRHDIPYTKVVQLSIEEHKKMRNEIWAAKVQSKDLYRSDNVSKRVWRSLRYIVTQKVKQLISSLPKKLQKEPVSVHAKLSVFLQKFLMAHDLRTYYVLLSCMIFLAMKHSYLKFIEKLNFEPGVHKYMVEETNKFKKMNMNKTRDIKWDEILLHPIFCLGKSLFYKQEAIQDSFFIKCFGPNQWDKDQSNRTRMTIIDDYELFRKTILSTLETRFRKLY